MQKEKKKKIRVAVVGSGLAGLTTAYLLARDVEQRYEVEVFEMGPSPSLDAASITVTFPTPTRLDVPMRAFAAGFYTNLLSLYAHLAIPYHPKEFVYSFSSPTTLHHHASNNHRFPPRPEGATWASHILNLVALYVVYTYFTVCAFHLPPRDSESFRCYLRRIRLPETATGEYLLPMFSAIATCTHNDLLDFPAADLIAYRKAVYKQPHYAVTGGVGKVQERLLERVQIHFSRRVIAVERSDDSITVRWEGGADIFGRVVLAVNPRVVGAIYKPLQEQMEKIPCCEVEVVVHTDGSLLEDLFPVSLGTQTEKKKALMGRRAVTAAKRMLGATGAEMVHLSTERAHTGAAVQTQSSHLHPPDILITTQPHRRVAADKVLGGTWFTRVLRNCESREVVRSLVAGDGEFGVWVVGGWVWDGMVLLEGCVVSAARVARAFGVEVPW